MKKSTELHGAEAALVRDVGEFELLESAARVWIKTGSATTVEDGVCVCCLARKERGKEMLEGLERKEKT